MTMETIPWVWLIWGLLVYIATQTIFGLTVRRREHLNGLLSQYIEIQKDNLRRKMRIAKLQQKIKKLKAEAKANAAKDMAEREREAMAAEAERRAA